MVSLTNNIVSVNNLAQKVASLWCSGYADS